MPTAMEKFLKASQEKWGEEAQRAKEAPDTGFKNYPDGKYIAQLSGAEIGESQSSGRIQIHWSYTILAGDQQGNTVHDYEGLDGENSLYYVARKLQKMGLDPSTVNFVKLEQMLEKLVAQEIVLKIRLKTKGDYQNTFVDAMMPDDWREDYMDDGDAPVAPPTPPTKKSASSDAPTPSAKTGVKSKVKPEEEKEEEEKEEKEEEKEEVNRVADNSDASEDEADLEVGMKVEFELKGKPVTGIVTEIDEDSETAQVKVGKTVYPVGFDDMTIVEEDE